MEKLEFLKKLLKERKPGVIHPMFFCNDYEIKKYNIKEDDFLMIIAEEPYAAIALGYRSWIIRIELSEEELLNINKREKYKLNLIRTYGKIPIKYLNGNWTNSWEHYERCCKNFSEAMKF